MKKILLMVISTLFLLTSNSYANDEIIGYWKNIKFPNDKTFLFDIKKYSYKKGSRLYAEVNFTHKNGLWLHDKKLPKNATFTAQTGFKPIDKNNFELFEIINGGSKSLGMYVRITKSEYDKIQNPKSFAPKQEVAKPVRDLSNISTEELINNTDKYHKEEIVKEAFRVNKLFMESTNNEEKRLLRDRRTKIHRTYKKFFNF